MSMLVARGQLRLGRAEQRWTLCFAPRIWISIVERRGLVVDTRFVAPSSDDAPPSACLYLLQRGRWRIHSKGGAEAMTSPSAFVVTLEQLEGRRGTRSFTYTALGEPYRAIELHVAAGDLMREPAAAPVPIDLPASVWAAADEVQRHATGDDDACRRVVRELLRRLGRVGVLRARAVDRALRRVPLRHALLWRGLRPMIENLYLTPTLQEVADRVGLSTRQVDRYIEGFLQAFGLVGGRWRSSTRYWRLKLAVILLSAEGASVADVARCVGYSGSDAMARAFRDAGLPPPATVQRDVAENIGCPSTPPRPDSERESVRNDERACHEVDPADDPRGMRIERHERQLGRRRRAPRKRGG